MIFVTGDTHGQADIAKLRNKEFKMHEDLTKNDYVIICGDFGGVWDNSKTDFYWRKWYNDKKYTLLFVDGNHENFDLLNAFSVQEWKGGKVHQVEESVFHLMRGQVFTIDGQKIFTMGGGTSIDKEWRKEGISWWTQEILNPTEWKEGLINLKAHNWHVDYIITHTASHSIMQKRLMEVKECSKLNSYLEWVQRNVSYKWWFFGHFHKDIVFREERCTCLYNKIRTLDNRIF